MGCDCCAESPSAHCAPPERRPNPEAAQLTTDGHKASSWWAGSSGRCARPPNSGITTHWIRSAGPSAWATVCDAPPMLSQSSSTSTSGLTRRRTSAYVSLAARKKDATGGKLMRAQDSEVEIHVGDSAVRVQVADVRAALPPGHCPLHSGLRRNRGAEVSDRRISTRGLTNAFRSRYARGSVVHDRGAMQEQHDLHDPPSWHAERSGSGRAGWPFRLPCLQLRVAAPCSRRRGVSVAVDSMPIWDRPSTAGLRRHTPYFFSSRASRRGTRGNGSGGSARCRCDSR